MEDIFLSAADFEREKTNESIREYVGEERKTSRSDGRTTRRDGFTKEIVTGSGTGGSEGVSGTGSGFCGACFFLRGTRRGRLLSFS